MSGILRRPSPTKEKVKVSSIRGGLQSGKTPTIINHNQNISPNIPQTASYDDSGMGWLSTPKFNTARTLVQKKHEILQTTSFNVNRVAELTPKTKAVVTEKVISDKLKMNSTCLPNWQCSQLSWRYRQFKLMAQPIRLTAHSTQLAF